MKWSTTFSAAACLAASALGCHAQDFGFKVREFPKRVQDVGEKYGLRVDYPVARNCKEADESGPSGGYCDTHIFGCLVRLGFEDNAQQISKISIYLSRYSHDYNLPLAISVIAAVVDPLLSGDEIDRIAARLSTVGNTLSGGGTEKGVAAQFSAGFENRWFKFVARPI